MQYPPFTQFGQTNLAKLHLSPYYMDYLSPVYQYWVYYNSGLNEDPEEPYRFVESWLKN